MKYHFSRIFEDLKIAFSFMAYFSKYSKWTHLSYVLILLLTYLTNANTHSGKHIQYQTTQQFSHIPVWFVISSYVSCPNNKFTNPALLLYWFPLLAASPRHLSAQHACIILSVTILYITPSILTTLNHYVFIADSPWTHWHSSLSCSNNACSLRANLYVWTNDGCWKHGCANDGLSVDNRH